MTQSFCSHFSVQLPDWVTDFAAQLPERLPTREERMALAVRLSRENTRQGTGGPFGAVVVSEDKGEIIALGVNRVEPDTCSAAHAEIVALSLAQKRLASWDLSATRYGPLQLITSCEPCAMCLGAIPWSGVQSVLCGATKADAEAAGFDEGDRPPAWTDCLGQRGIQVVTGLLREEAAAALMEYRNTGGVIY